jgi:capsular exopolysaccharide synthesis family protein
MTALNPLMQTPGNGIEKSSPIMQYIQTSPAHWQASNTFGGIARYIQSVRRHVWAIGIFIILSVIATYVISSRLRPLYESTATIDIDPQAPSAVIGQDSYRNYGRTSVEADAFLATQTKLIESDAVLRPVAQKYDLVRREEALDFQFPWERWLRKDDNQSGRDGQEAPIGLHRLKITRPPNTYLLLIRYQSSDPKLASQVANAIAESYLQHLYDIRTRSSASLATFMETQSAELKAKMERSSQALARMEKDLGVLSSDEKTNVLASRLVQLNADYTNAQSDRLKKESIWKSVNNGSLEALQVSGQADQLTLLNQKLNESEQKMAELGATYGSAHPEHRKIAAEIDELNAEIEAARNNISKRVQADYEQALRREQMFSQALAVAKAQADEVNARFFQYAELKHEAESDKKLYEELVWKIKEAVTNAGFQTNNIRIADVARPGLKPVFPNKGLNVLLAFLLSTVLAVSAASAYDAVDNTVREPDQLNRAVQADVIATLPIVKRQNAMVNRKAILSIGDGSTTYENRGDIVVDEGPVAVLNGYSEAIRSLRNTLELSATRSPLRSLVIASANVGEGKTTTAVNLAIAHAKRQRKTLLIDADLRNPKIHKVFNMPNTSGLSTMLETGPPWSAPGTPLPVVSIASHPNLFVIPAGTIADRPSDIIGGRLVTLVEELRKVYDLIIIDTPPLLGFAEPLELARAGDAVLLVARAGKTKISEVAAVLSQLNRISAKTVGIVLNRTTHNARGIRYYYAYDDSQRRNNDAKGSAALIS